MYEGMDSARTDSSSLREYVGLYYSDETESATEILTKKGALFLKRKAGVEVPLIPLYKDGFSFPGGVLYFNRDTIRKVTGFLASIPRARNVNFVRKK